MNLTKKLARYIRALWASRDLVHLDDVWDSLFIDRGLSIDEIKEVFRKARCEDAFWVVYHRQIDLNDAYAQLSDDYGY